MTRRSDERGIALILAVFALVVIGALVAGVFYTAQLEQRSGGNALAGQQAADAAQSGIDYAIANWNNAWTTMGTGNSVTIASTQLGTSPEYFNATVTALNGFTYLMTSTGQVKNGAGTVLATRAYGMIYKKNIPTLNVQSSVTVAGGVSVGGSADINGNDVPPTAGGWSSTCAGQPTTNQPAIRTDSSVSTHGSPTLTGGTVSNDTTVGTTITDVNQAYNTFINSANVTIPSGTITGADPALNASHVCDRTNTSNWGDPEYKSTAAYTVGATTTHPCASYYPIIHATGDLKVTGDIGQGILLVDGNFTSGGGFTFYGLVIVKGSITKGAGTSNFYGGLLSESASITDDLTGTINIQYSSCAINTAVSQSAVARPIVQRPFIQY
ncbi:MAG TPA: hypothetical protein VFI39_01685 [Gemmatimonadales bacterium]|nr:hypothetical protein [Gemmatimonadales bacterium]